MPITTYYDVVDNFYSEQSTGADQLPCDVQVSGRWGHLS